MTYNEQIFDTAELLRHSQRPVFVWGAGMRGCRDEALSLARSLDIPICCTWGAIDLLSYDDELNIGGFGTHGVRAANLAVQNADLIISLGSRLDTKATGTPSEFAPKAKIVMVDIDAKEIAKFKNLGRTIDVGICEDAGNIVESLRQDLFDSPYQMVFNGWLKLCNEWKFLHRPTGKAYDLMRQIGSWTNAKDIIVSDTGNTLGWIMQGFPFKGERFIHAFNFTPMGYGLGAAIGAAFASDNRIVCIVGDGGIMESLPELATIKRNNLNIKIVLINNGCHSMCMATQRQWLGGNYYATSIEGGLGFPEDWRMLAESFGIDNVYSFDEWNSDRPSFMEVKLAPEESLAFQVKYGDPLA